MTTVIAVLIPLLALLAGGELLRRARRRKATAKAARLAKFNEEAAPLRALLGRYAQDDAKATQLWNELQDWERFVNKRVNPDSELAKSFWVAMAALKQAYQERQAVNRRQKYRDSVAGLIQAWDDAKSGAGEAEIDALFALMKKLYTECGRSLSLYDMQREVLAELGITSLEQLDEALRQRVARLYDELAAQATDSLPALGQLQFLILRTQRDYNGPDKLHLYPEGAIRLPHPQEWNLWTGRLRYSPALSDYADLPELRPGEAARRAGAALMATAITNHEMVALLHEVKLLLAYGNAGYKSLPTVGVLFADLAKLAARLDQQLRWTYDDQPSRQPANH